MSETGIVLTYSDGTILGAISSMTNLERLAYSEKKLDEAIKNGTDADIHYWRGYRDAVSRCVERGESE